MTEKEIKNRIYLAQKKLLIANECDWVGESICTKFVIFKYEEMLLDLYFNSHDPLKYKR